MTSYTRCFAWSGNPWRTKEKWTREGKYINGGCLSKRHAQASYQKQNRSREPPRSLISTHASFLHTHYKRLFIVNTECWWKRISLPPFIIFVDIIHQDFRFQGLENSFASSLDDNRYFCIIPRALVSWRVLFSNHCRSSCRCYVSFAIFKSSIVILLN